MSVRSKNTPFEQGIRTPILIAWEDEAKPGTHAGLVSTVDLAPTLLAADGIEESGQEASGGEPAAGRAGAGFPAAAGGLRRDLSGLRHGIGTA